MPTTTITTTLERLDDRRAIARAIATVFRSIGLRDEHITTTFVPVSTDDHFVGDATLRERAGERHFVLAHVELGEHRGATVRSALASAVVEATVGIVAPSDVAVTFVDRRASDVYVGGVPMGASSVSSAPSPGQPATPGGFDGALRAFLARYWQVGHEGWDPATPLLALRPDDDDEEWDSLAVATLAVALELNLGLTTPIETGSEAMRSAFGDGATYQDLLEFLVRIPA